jgi:hypothetical protein
VKLGDEIMTRHRIACGDSATFQGDERDIVFLSMIADQIASRQQTCCRALWNIFYTPSTPPPPALPVFATGLGAIGLLAWGGKRKTTWSVFWIKRSQKGVMHRGLARSGNHSPKKPQV